MKKRKYDDGDAGCLYMWRWSRKNPDRAYESLSGKGLMKAMSHWIELNSRYYERGDKLYPTRKSEFDVREKMQEAEDALAQLLKVMRQRREESYMHYSGEHPRGRHKYPPYANNEQLALPENQR